MEFEDGSSIVIKIPSDYAGTDNCTYTNTTDFNDDAAKIAVDELFEALDFDNDGKIDYKFSTNDLQIELNELTGIPFAESNEIQVRVWR